MCLPYCLTTHRMAFVRSRESTDPTSARSQCPAGLRAHRGSGPPPFPRVRSNLDCPSSSPRLHRPTAAIPSGGDTSAAPGWPVACRGLGFRIPIVQSRLSFPTLGATRLPSILSSAESNGTNAPHLISILHSAHLITTSRPAQPQHPIQCATSAAHDSSLGLDCAGMCRRSCLGREHKHPLDV